MDEITVYLHKRQRFKQGDEIVGYGPGEVSLPRHVAKAFGCKVPPKEPKAILSGGVVKALVDAGYTTPESVRNATDDELLSVDGIGEKSLEKIRQRYN